MSAIRSVQREYVSVRRGNTAVDGDSLVDFDDVACIG